MAARFWVNGGDGNWGSMNNWSNTSGGSSGASVPTNADDVTFDSSGNSNCIVNASNRSCKTLTVSSGYTSTITLTFRISVFGDIVLSSGFTFAGAEYLAMVTTGSSITTNGVVLPGFLIQTANSTYTINDVVNCVNFFGNFSGGGQGVTLNGTLNISGNCLHNVALFRGTGTMTLTGTGTWSGTGYYGKDLVINTSGTITITSNLNLGTNLSFPGNTITYTAGTIVGSSTYSLFHLVNSTLNLSGITWNNLSPLNIINTPQVTLLSDLTTNNIILPSTIDVSYLGNSYKVIVLQDIVLNGRKVNFNETTSSAALSLAGTGTITSGGGNINVPTEVIGNYTLLDDFRYRYGTFKYTSGSFVCGAYYFIIASNGTLDFNGYSITNFATENSGNKITLKSTIIISANFNSYSSSNSSRNTFVSDVPSTRRKLTLLQGANQIVGYTDATDIDSDDGQTIWSFNGVLNNTVNWNQLVVNNQFTNTMII